MRFSQVAGAVGAASFAVLAVALLLPPLGSKPAVGSKPLGAQNITGVCPLGFGLDNLGDTKLPSGHPPVGLREDIRVGSRADPDVFVYHNADFWTGDPKKPTARAMSVSAGRILQIGSLAEVLQGAPPTSTGVDLQSQYVTPGFVDAHVHLVSAGEYLSGLDLRTITGQAALDAQVRAAAADTVWILGHGWDESRWGGGLPSADWTNAASGGRPLFLTRMDAHMALVNDVALRMAGITSETPDPEGGQIVKDGDGKPTGILKDHAMQLVSNLIPSATVEQRRAAVVKAARHALTKGVTTVHDLGRISAGPEGVWEDLEQLYTPMADAGELPIRVYAFVPLTTWERMADKVKRQGRSHAGERLRWGGVKAFADGSLGSATALMHEPYLDNPANSGIRLTDPAELAAMVKGATAAGLQAAVHAIGDKAVDEVLSMFARMPAAAGSARRSRVEHAQHLSSPAAAEAFNATGATAIANPQHLLEDARVLRARLGPLRADANHSWPLHSLLQAGAGMAFGSDWPVVPIDPLEGMYAAVHRRAPPDPHAAGSGAARGFEGGVWGPEAAISSEEALRAQTTGSAWAGGMEDLVGSLRPGMQADFVVLSRPPWSMEQDAVLPEVVATYVDGVCMHGC